MVPSKEQVASAIAKAQAELEEALCQLEKIPAFDATSVAFAAHMLNNYLTVTGGTVELLLELLADQPDPQVRIWLEGVQHATNLMVRAVSQLINASAATDIHLRIEEVDLPLLVQRACNYYQRVADRKAIRVSAATAAIHPVRTDRVAVAAVLDTPLSNAIKYSPPGKRVSVQVQSEPNWAVCKVQDEGPGLSPDDQARLFQRGARLTPRPTGDESSTGYGLAVAKDLIEKLGGQISCKSTLGHGSCFSFRLPTIEDVPPAPAGW